VNHTTPSARNQWLRNNFLIAQPPLLDRGGEFHLPCKIACHCITTLLAGGELTSLKGLPVQYVIDLAS